MSFDPDDYRKRVLAPIEARGGLPASDPFEWYDIALDGSRDRDVRSQVDAVWAFWQKQRQAPKYRGLVLALLARHEEFGPLLWKSDTRERLAAQVREQRAVRAVDRFAELDAAAERLVERWGGVPRGKVEGLVAFGSGKGLSTDQVQQRLRRWPVVDDVTVTAALDPYRQVRKDLEELARLMEDEPFPSLLALLGVEPTASLAQIVRARDEVASRNRELLPDRRRALVDDLLAAVTALLIDADPDAYLADLAADVTEQLRPRFAAAVLVEDVLTPSDAEQLVKEAQALGLDPDRARDVLVRLAQEAGVAVPRLAPRSPATPTSAPTSAPTSDPPAPEVPERYQRQAPRPARPARDTVPEHYRRGAPPPPPPVREVVADPQLAPVSGLEVSASHLTWVWPSGCTEVLVMWRRGAPPAGPHDPLAERKKVTNSRYELDGGLARPPGEDVHVAVFTCTRIDGALVPSPDAPHQARAVLTGSGNK